MLLSGRCGGEQDFSPSSLVPTWQLDATLDFGGTADGAPVPQWKGSGISSNVQTTVASQPVYQAGSVVFDGAGDNLQFPMWPGGVGSEWTLALLIKVRPGITNYRQLFGGSFQASRVLEGQWFQAGLSTRTSYNTDLGLFPNHSLFPDNNWRILVMRCGSSKITARIDGVESEWYAPMMGTAQAGTFNLGCSYDPVNLSAPITVRYGAFFSHAIADDDLGKLERWMERKKAGEYPESMVFLGSGQSNFSYSYNQLRPTLATAFPNPVVAFGTAYSATSLMAWMRDKADGSGYEVTPRVDLGAAPQSSLAYGRQELHGGDTVLAEWQASCEAVRRNPKSLTAMLFIQGENDTDDAVNQWKPNGVPGGPVDYNAHYTNHFALADSYGPRSLAWNQAVRDATGFKDLVCVYERVNYVGLNRLPIQVQCEFRQRYSQILALSSDPRYLLVDTTDLPREDGIHFTTEGAQRFSNAVVRLLKNSAKLAKLSYHARILAMRAVDAGMVLDDAGFAACETFVTGPEFARVRSLVIPVLPAADPFDRARLDRCDLLVHLAGLDAPAFWDAAPAHVSVTAGSGGNDAALDAGVHALLSAWGVSDTVTIIPGDD